MLEAALQDTDGEVRCAVLKVVERSVGEDPIPLCKHYWKHRLLLETAAKDKSKSVREYARKVLSTIKSK